MKILSEYKNEMRAVAGVDAELQALVTFILKEIEKFPAKKIINGETFHNGKYGSFIGCITGKCPNTQEYLTKLTVLKDLNFNSELILHFDSGFSIPYKQTGVEYYYEKAQYERAEKIGKIAAKAFIQAGGRWSQRIGKAKRLRS